MINIYQPSNTTYSNNGDATLTPIYCTQKVNINGVWQVVMEHPYDKEGRWKYIATGAMLKIHTTAVETSSNYQLYRIYSVQTGLHSVYCEALPIALDAYNDTNVNSLVVDNKTGTELATTLNGLWNKYTITSNISTANSAKYQNTNLIEILNGGDKCFAKLWKGEIKYDNTAISINTRLDSNPASYNLRLGRDIKDIKYTIDETDVITRIYPIGASGARLNYQDVYRINDGNSYVDSTHINNYPIIHNAYVKTDYLICTTKSDSKDQYAYNETADLLGDVSYNVTYDYNAALNLFMSDDYECKGNISFLKSVLKLTKKKDGITGLVEELKNNISYLKNDELKKYINQTIDGSVDFIDAYEESKWLLTKVGDRMTTLVDGMQINKGKDNECVNFVLDTSKVPAVTKLVGLVFSNDGKVVEREEWNGRHTESEFSIKVDLDIYYGIRIYYEVSFPLGETLFPLIGEVPVSTLTTSYNTWTDGIRLKRNEESTKLWFELDITKIDEVTKIVGTKHNKAGKIVTTNIWSGSEYSAEFSKDINLENYESLSIYYVTKLPIGETTMPLITEVTTENIPYDLYRYILQNPQFTGESEWVVNEWQRIDNRWRRFDEDGYMLTLSDTSEWGWWDKSDHYAYYGSADEFIYVYDQWLKINGEWIWFDEDGWAYRKKAMINTLAAIFNTPTSAHLIMTLTAGEESLYQNFYQRLTDYAQAMFGEGVDLPTVSIDVDAMVLNNIVGYQGFATLKLGNGVHVDFGDLEADERVIGIEYDCVAERNSKIILGVPTDTITSMINRKADVGSGYVGGYGIKIENNLITFSGDSDGSIAGGGSGAADISVLPIQRDGTPVADLVVDDHTYHLYGGLMYWEENREIIETSLDPIIIDRIRDYHLGQGQDWSAEKYEINGNSSLMAKVYYGTGSIDDNYDAFILTGHELAFCYEIEMPYDHSGGHTHTSFQVVVMAPEMTIEQNVVRSHDGFYHRDIDNGFLIEEWTVNAPNVGGGQYWKVGHQGAIYDNDAEHYIASIKHMGVFPPPADATAFLQQLCEQVMAEANPVDVSWNCTVTVLEESENQYILWGGRTNLPSEYVEGDAPWEYVTAQDFPFRITKGGTIYCTGLYIDGVNPFVNVIKNVKVNEYSIVDRTNATAIIKLGANLDYDTDTRTIVATDTTYDVFETGEDGLVPAPLLGDADKFLKGDGTWAEVKINNARTIAWKNITPAQYETLSSAEKANGVIYLVSDNAQGASGFFTPWKSVTSAPSTADNTLYLESSNANGAMSMEITPTETTPSATDNQLYFIGG